MPRLLSFLVLAVLTSPASAQPNLLLIIADDVGVDLVGAYNESSLDVTPEIDSLASQGIMFRNAWSAPLCSATRASILTGRYGFRTGVGAAIPSLPDTFDTLPQLLVAHESYAVGKWHITPWNPNKAPPNDGYTPIEAGFLEFHGSTMNIDSPETYFSWEKIEEVAPAAVVVTADYATYATTDSVDDALTIVGAAGEPWFIYLALNAIHYPRTVPPDALHTQAGVKAAYDPGDDGGTDVDVAVAMLEAMDTEVGRLLDGLDLADTVVAFVGDNGSPYGVATDPVNRGAKSLIWEGGINVPLIVAGVGVAVNQETAALAHTVDLFPTLLDLSGSAPIPDGLDGVSLVPVLSDASMTVRETVYTDGRFVQTDELPDEQNPVNHDVAVRNSRYKMIRRSCTTGRSFELYDLLSDPRELINLWDSQDPEVQQAQGLLSLELTAVTGSFGGCQQRGCGLGIELALLLPPLMWLSQRRRRRA